jgi:elongation factor G
MPTYSTADIRNIALVGHGGAGKTTLAEALLKAAGAIGKAGSVEAGDTVSDFTDEEKHHGHSLFNAVMHCDYQGKHINLIDTPGYPEFAGQAYGALPPVETVAVVINAGVGIEPNARRMMQIARERNLCRMIIINRIDHENVDLMDLLEQIREAFGPECLPLNLPADGATRVVDCFAANTGDSDLGPVAEYHTNIIDQVVEVDEDLMALYLEQGEDLKPEQLHAPFEKALREGHLVPVCFTAARTHADSNASIGVRELLDVLMLLAPNPMEGNPRPFIKGEDVEHELHATPDPKMHVLAHVFQVSIDPFMGKLSIFRVHQGTLTTQSQLFVGHPKVGESKKPFKIGHLFKLHGKERVEIDGAIPGDIAAVAKIDEIHRDSVLHDSHDEDLIHLRPLPIPQPMYGLAIETKSRSDETKIGDVLHKIAEEDPTFVVTRDSTTHETVIHGMGELHLRVILEKIRSRYHMELATHPPKIAYRETIQKPAKGHHRHKKQTGGAGQFGEVHLRIEPLDRGAGVEFVSEIVGGVIPGQYIPAIEKGVRSVIDAGCVAGYPMQDVRVVVTDGKHHPVDSKEIAFVTAGKRAFMDAVSSASPTLLEPMVRLDVTVPNQFMGDITGDLSSKRGRILGTDMLGSEQAVVSAVAPLGEVMSYQNQLKSVTGGQGSYAMELSGYEPLPPHLQEQIIAQYKPRHDDD